MTRSFLIENEEKMRRLGAALAERLFRSAFIALYGGLGAGKTTLVRGVAESLGVDSVSSPTFTIVHSYTGRSGMVLDHFDAYRLADCDELYAMGFDEYLSSDSVILMEWCENVPEAVPEHRLEIHIDGSGSDARSVVCRAFGSEYYKMLTGIRI